MASNRLTSESESLAVGITLDDSEDKIILEDPEQQAVTATDVTSGTDTSSSRAFCRTDHGSWSLIVLLASFLNCYVVGCMFISFSVLYIYFVEHFNSEKAVTGWIGSLFLASGNIFGIVFSVFIKFYGCRLVAVIGGFVWFFGFAVSALAPDITFLYFSYGLVAGMGFNMVTLSSFVIVQQYFEKHRALAAGMAAAGISVGSLTSGPIVGCLVETYGWRGALLILSGMVANCSVLGSLYRPIRLQNKSTSIGKQNVKLDNIDVKEVDPAPKDHNVDSVCKVFSQLFKDMINCTLFQNAAFTLCCIGTFCMNFGLAIFYQHTPSRAVFLGIEKSLAVLLPTAISVTTLIARILGSIIGNMSCTNRTLQYAVCVMCGGILLIITAQATTFLSIALLGAAIGFHIGCSLTVQTTVMSDLVGVTNVARAQAFILVFSGLGALIGVPLAGFIYDKTNNYNIPFYTGGAVQTFGGILMIIGAILRKIEVNRKT